MTTAEELRDASTRFVRVLAPDKSIKGVQMFDLDARPGSLLTYGNPKTAKGEGYGVLTAVMHFAPAQLSGRNVCSHSTAGCENACLGVFAGRGGIGIGDLPSGPDEALQEWLADMPAPTAVIQVARIRRTRYLTRERVSFLATWALETRRHELRARAHGLKCAERPNGTSDIPWENVPITAEVIAEIRRICPRNLRKWARRLRASGYPHIFAMFPRIRFYDYTKMPAQLRRRALSIPNYHLTYSLAESNEDKARAAAGMGLNVAVVFAVKRGRPLPETFWGRRVIDADLTDLRYLDPAGVVCGLRAKGGAVNDRTGFVRR
jgi:hypothetical protein